MKIQFIYSLPCRCEVTQVQSAKHFRSFTLSLLSKRGKCVSDLRWVHSVDLVKGGIHVVSNQFGISGLVEILTTPDEVNGLDLDYVGWASWNHFMFLFLAVQHSPNNWSSWGLVLKRKKTTIDTVAAGLKYIFGISGLPETWTTLDELYGAVLCFYVYL